MWEELGRIFSHPWRMFCTIRERAAQSTEEEKIAVKACLDLRNCKRTLFLCLWTFLYIASFHVVDLPIMLQGGVTGDPLLFWADMTLLALSAICFAAFALMLHTEHMRFAGLLTLVYNMAFSVFMTILIIKSVGNGDIATFVYVSCGILLVLPIVKLGYKLLMFLPPFCTYAWLYVKGYVESANIIVMAWFFGIMLLMSALMYFTYYNNELQRIHLEDATETLENQLQLQLQHYKKFEERNLELSTFRHDMRNHLSVVRSLLKDGDEARAEEYLQKLTEGMVNRGGIISSGNPILDAVLTQKKELAEADNIGFTMELKVPQNLKIEPLDVCKIFGNLLDNALESCKKCKENTKISLKICMKGNCLGMKMSNTALDEPKKQKGGFRTDKKDVHHHGYGIKSANQSVKKYGGEMTLEWVDGLFVTELFLQDVV